MSSVSSGGFLRWRLAKSLRSAYADGLITRDTFTHRIDHLYGGSGHLVDPQQLVGDLNFRRETRWLDRGRLASVLWHRKHDEDDEIQLPILVLDWSGATSEMLLGRGTECDLLIPDRSVSRRHAQLFFRDGKWILVDLDSKNGTFINGVQVQRAELLPGDVVALGVECLRVD
jgi:hypothetical protein